MDYKQKYEEALEAIRKLREANPSDEGIQNWVNDNFPELREIEDERIRGLIYCLIRDRSDNGKLLEHHGVSVDEALAWLENQRHITSEEFEQGKADVLWCIKQAKKNAKDENDMGTCWFAEKWLEKQGRCFKFPTTYDNMETRTTTLEAMQKPIDEGLVLKSARKDVALSIINFLDYNTTSMDMSSGECEDLEDAVLNSDWMKVYRYMKKKLEKQGEVYNDNILSRDDDILQALSIGLTDISEKLGWGDFGGLPIGEIQEWLEKQGEKPDDNVEPKIDDKGLSEFENALANACNGWHGFDIGWEDYIKTNADALLKISFKMWNDVQDVPFEQKPAEWSENLVKEALLSEVLPCFMHGGEADEVVAKLDEVMSSKVSSRKSKPAWSEEDEEHIEWILSCLYDGLYKTEEQFKSQFKTAITWLKSLKPQKQWKPTQRQIRRLEAITYFHDRIWSLEEGKDMIELLEQLKQL